jgi:hypothetical protein
MRRNHLRRQGNKSLTGSFKSKIKHTRRWLMKTQRARWVRQILGGACVVIGAGLASNVITSPEKSVISALGILAVFLIICGYRLWTFSGKDFHANSTQL